jgi:hypothetical protein
MDEKFEVNREDLVTFLRVLDSCVNEYNLDEESPELLLLRKWEKKLGGSIMYGTL